MKCRNYGKYDILLCRAMDAEYRYIIIISQFRIGVEYAKVEVGDQSVYKVTYPFDLYSCVHYNVIGIFK